MTRAEFRAGLKGRRCYVGVDLGSTKDLTATVAAFPDDVGLGFDVLAQFFVPDDNIAERVRRDHVPYDLWKREGFLIATPGPVTDYEYVRHHLHAWADEFQVLEIPYDPWNATDVVSRLLQDGLPMVPIRQGFASLTAPTKSLETAILSKRLRHDGHPILRWNIGNIVVELDAAGNYKISKHLSTEKVDGAAALVNAIDRMDRNRGDDTPSDGPLVVAA
jgi:phage terminase large subunit-like protein